MAVSPAHKFGQFIGDVLEEAAEPLLREFSRRHGLYLDRREPRPARRGVKVSWRDSFGNAHDLDFVLERGGTRDKMGVPAAFIETAWRRYTKHSRNKAQEIQGAILPLTETYRAARPFTGAILAGVFTEPALAQMRSLGFTVLYFPLDTVVEAFREVGVDAYFDERTSLSDLENKVRAMERLSAATRSRVAATLLQLNRQDTEEFMMALDRSVTRQVECVRVLPLHGTVHSWPSVAEAIGFIAGYGEDAAALPTARYEVQIRYSNGDTIEGRFAGKEDAILFLRGFEP